MSWLTPWPRMSTECPCAGRGVRRWLVLLHKPRTSEGSRFCISSAQCRSNLAVMCSTLSPSGSSQMSSNCSGFLPRPQHPAVKGGCRYKMQGMNQMLHATAASPSEGTRSGKQGAAGPSM